MMEELVRNLAALQTERIARETAADKESAATDLLIKLAEEELASLIDSRRDERQIDEIAVYELDVEIESLKTQIIEAWDGEKKTQQYPAGTLKFRTTQSLKIQDAALTLTGLLDHTSVKDVANNYIKGFNLTAVKKYMGVLDLPMGAAEIEHKTTVKLDD